MVLLDGVGRGEGAPSEAAISDLVVLTEVPESDPYYAAVKALGHEAVKEVVPFRVGQLDSAFKRLQQRRPGFVIVVARPDSLDVNFQFEFLERASRLDDDPFVDFAFGYVTGATAAEAVAFAEGIAAARKRGIPKAILEFGPTSAPQPVTAEGPHEWAKGFTTRRLGHAENDARIAEALRGIRGVGIYHAWGHGSADRVSDGLSGAQIRAAGLDLAPSLYFSGPCYGGVTARWFGPERGAITEMRVDPRSSFVLALVAARVTAAFAGFDPDRGEMAEHELEHLLETGEPLGMAAKSTYDDAVLAYRRPKFLLPRYAAGKGAPFRDIHDQMISGGAGRALFGDPTYAPFAASGSDPFRVETKRTKEGLLVTWRGDESAGRRWSAVDVNRAAGGWTQRVRFRFDLPREDAAKIQKFEVVAVTKDGRPLAYTYPTAALETWGDRVRVHGMLIFPPDPQHPAMSGGKALEARFLFRE